MSNEVQYADLLESHARLKTENERLRKLVIKAVEHLRNSNDDWDCSRDSYTKAWNLLADEEERIEGR